MDLRALPKIELHSHLDCALGFDAVHAIDHHISRDDYESRFVAPRQTESLSEYLAYTLNYRKILQTEGALRIAVQDVFAQMQRENVIYGELRFAPLVHTEGDLDPEEVVRTVADETVTQIAMTGIEANVILCTLRDYSAAQSMALEHMDGFTAGELSERLGKDSDAVLDQLAADPRYAYLGGGKWNTMDAYLTGELWPKLDAVKAALAAGSEPDMADKRRLQAERLEAAIGSKLLEAVDFQMNSAWVPKWPVSFSQSRWIRPRVSSVSSPRRYSTRSQSAGSTFIPGWNIVTSKPSVRSISGRSKGRGWGTKGTTIPPETTSTRRCRSTDRGRVARTSFTRCGARWVTSMAAALASGRPSAARSTLKGRSAV